MFKNKWFKHSYTRFNILFAHQSCKAISIKTLVKSIIHWMRCQFVFYYFNCQTELVSVWHLGGVTSLSFPGTFYTWVRWQKLWQVFPSDLLHLSGVTKIGTRLSQEPFTPEWSEKHLGQDPFPETFHIWVEWQKLWQDCPRNLLQMSGVTKIVTRVFPKNVLLMGGMKKIV